MINLETKLRQKVSKKVFKPFEKPAISMDQQTQFGNTRQFNDPSDCMFVFKNTDSDYEEPLSDSEVSFMDWKSIVAYKKNVVSRQKNWEKNKQLLKKQNWENQTWTIFGVFGDVWHVSALSFRSLIWKVFEYTLAWCKLKILLQLGTTINHCPK